VESLRGQLLLAAPNLLDPNFHRTVVLVSEHNDQGAMGVVLNRPSTMTVGEAVPALGKVLSAEQAVFVGGPVAPTSIILLAEFLDPELASLLVFGRVGLPAAEVEIDQLVRSIDRARVFAGYAGWGPGQLEGELENEDWITHPAGPQDVFGDEAPELWGAVLGRKGGRYALLASLPPDPSLN
jgi:putative transcriptional regulator